MTTKTYTNRSNCVRAAKKALGATAKAGVDFLIAGSGKEWTFAAKGGKAKREKRPVGQRSSILKQPRFVQMLGYIKSGTATTVKAIAARMGGCTTHNVRGMVSRGNAEGAGIYTTRDGRVVHYTLVKPEAKAEA